MSNFLERAIKNGISRGLSDAVGKAVQKVVEPKATEFVNKTASELDRVTNTPERKAARSSLEDAMSNLERSMQNYATQAAKNVKVCPGCGEPAGVNEKFCPSCGAKLPEQTLAAGAVCPSCGKQNNLGTKFCSDCGTKLPHAIQEEQEAQAEAEAVMARWDELLPQYPKWTCGGEKPCIDTYDGWLTFSATFASYQAGKMAVEQYRQTLLQNGFRQAGQYPSPDQLFKKIGGVCYNVDLEHCFEGNPETPTIGFAVREPSGGFDYVKPEPRKKISFLDLFK